MRFPSIIALRLSAMSPLALASLATAQIEFTNVTSRVGLAEPFNDDAHAAIWGDVNGDGWPDVLFGSFTYGPQVPDKIFLNHGGTSFKEIKGPFNIVARNSGSAFADFDNDGDMDLITGHNSRRRAQDTPSEISIRSNYLFENTDGKGAYRDVTQGSGVGPHPGFTTRNTLVFDFDGDGILDILLNRDYVDEITNSMLLRGRGDFTFEDVTKKAGIPDGTVSLGGLVGDLNGDGWPDIFLPPYDRSKRLNGGLLINNRDGTFHAVNTNTGNEASTGANLGDFNNDGRIDVIVGNHNREGPPFFVRVFLNQGNDAQGNPIFEEVTQAAGMQDGGTRQPDLHVVDVDNDGLPDIVSSEKNSMGFAIWHHQGLVNGVPRFKRLGSPRSGYWIAMPPADYDRDGLIDFFAASAGGGSVIFRNTTRGAGNWLQVDMKLQNPSALKQNINGIGARVSLYQAGQAGKPEARLGTNILSVANGYSAGYEPMAHFGLGAHKQVDVVVQLPNGGPTWEFPRVNANQRLTVTGGTATRIAAPQMAFNAGSNLPVFLYDAKGIPAQPGQSVKGFRPSFKKIK